MHYIYESKKNNLFAEYLKIVKIAGLQLLVGGPSRPSGAQAVSPTIGVRSR